MDKNSLRNFTCRTLGDLVVISFDSIEVLLSRGDAELYQAELAHHVHFGDAGMEVAGFQMSMDDAFILNEVLQVAFQEGYGIAFGGEDER